MASIFKKTTTRPLPANAEITETTVKGQLVGDLSFGDVPFAKLKLSNEKNRQGSTVPLRSDLA